MIKKIYLTIIIILTINVLCSTINTLEVKFPKVTIKNRLFTDEYGRARIFHGVNVVYKVAPFIPSNGEFDSLLSFNDEDIKVHMKRFGFNLVRLGVIWEAIEKQPGVYDEELLDEFVNLVNRLGKNGIYTIVDAHQDLFSRQVCGEGVPHFYVEELIYDQDCVSTYFKQLLKLVGVCKSILDYNLQSDEEGLPLVDECKKNIFHDYHKAPELTSLYEKLYENEKGLLDKFINFWVVVALKFKNNPYVLGYDIWNEPLPGDLFNNPSRFIPGRSDDTQLLDFYRKVDEKIREVDSEYTLMYEPTPFPDNLPIFWKYYKGNFSDVPLKKENLKEKQIYNYHSYCCLATLDMCHSGEPPLDQKDLCRQMHANNAKDAEDYSRKFGIGNILSEFGACYDSEACYNEVTSVTAEADKYFTSWAYWMYKPFKDFTTSCPDDKEGMFNQDGTVQTWKEKALTRSYVQAFQGIPISMKFSPEDKSLIFEFINDFDIQEPTVVYYNKELNYKEGVEVNVTDENNQSVFIIDDSEENILKIRLNRKENNVIKNSKVIITITPKNLTINNTNKIEF